MVRWVHPTLGAFEGSAAEIAETVQRLQALAAPLGAAPALVAVPPLEETTQLSLFPDAAPSRRLRNPPTNEQLIHDYEQDTGLTPPVRRVYVNTIREFEFTTGSSVSLLDATQDHVRAFERKLLQNCAHLQVTRSNGPRAAAVPRERCRKGEYDWTPVRPEECGAKCPMFERQLAGPQARLRQVKHFYDFLREKGLVSHNPAEFVFRRHAKTIPESDEPLKYDPGREKVRTLVRAARDVLTLRDVAVLAVLAKWGRRPDHTLMLEASELVGVMPGSEGPAHATFAGVKRRVLARNLGGSTKLKGNLVSPIDDELLQFLREEYLPYRQARWGYAWNEGPLFPGDRGRGPLHMSMLQEWVLDPLMEHLARASPSEAERAEWREHARAQSPTRISPGCFRHFFTTRLEEFGVPELDIDILRGDRVRGAKRKYLHLSPEKVCAKYPRGFELLAPSSAAPQEVT